MSLRLRRARRLCMSFLSAKSVGVSLVLLSILSGCVVVEDGPRPYPPGPPGPPPGPQVCPQIYAPVCGDRNGRLETLPNQCVARAQGFRIVADGECRRPGPPPRPGFPGGPGPGPGWGGPGGPGGPGPGWGGGPGPGRPGGPGICTREYAPVCGRRGPQFQTFGNACEADNSGFRVVAQGPC